MNHDEIIYLQRLTYIKFLWLQAEEQARQAEPFCNFALLSMQDAIEMFIHTGILKHNAKKNLKDGFEIMWNSLNEKLLVNHRSLTQKPSILQVNSARVSLKHHSTFPSVQQLNEYVVFVKTFFKENTPLVFDVEFDSISLADLIINEEIREHIKKAELYLSTKSYNESVTESALGMRKLIDYFNEKARSQSGYRNSISDLRSIIKDVRINPDYQTLGSGASKEMNCTRSLSKQTENFLKKTEEVIEKIDAFIRLNALGIPYGKYVRFNSIVPEIRYYLDGHYKVQKYDLNISDSNEVQFCISFVVESALKEQSFQW